MAEGKKSGTGLGIVGLLLVVIGAIFLGTGKTSLGLSLLLLGLVLVVAGAAASRQAKPPSV
jgi:uncharacterized membrane protein HdeD (DUF308 family)